ncbi:hypothetical protein DPMN_113777 [Dreissena polymorpha]|uniref:Uncharacterized protein n=1 Tax=Dreissena polymorpha TaxID=45954 RepID=A0A9D4QS64_DREPO|nr:hypothetical protein DPMN_113777 [Dreissena polymorpha]
MRRRHVFPPTGTIFELIQDTAGDHEITKGAEGAGELRIDKQQTHFQKNAPPPDHFRSHPRYHLNESSEKFHDDRTINVTSRVKNAPPPGGHVFQPKDIIF